MSNKQKLVDAFERIKNGRPIRIAPNRKISPAAVEDEAGLSRSLLRNNEEYRELFDEIVVAKKRQSKPSKAVKDRKPTSTDPAMKALREELSKAKQTIKDLERKYGKLLACNAELTQVICEKRFQQHSRSIVSQAVENLVEMNKE